jgi:hypothetical protein
LPSLAGCHPHKAAKLASLKWLPRQLIELVKTLKRHKFELAARISFATVLQDDVFAIPIFVIVAMFRMRPQLNDRPEGVCCKLFVSALDFCRHQNPRGEMNRQIVPVSGSPLVEHQWINPSGDRRIFDELRLMNSPVAAIVYPSTLSMIALSGTCRQSRFEQHAGG